MKKLCIPVLAIALFSSSKMVGQSKSEMLDYSYDRNFRLELTSGFGKGINTNSFQATKYMWIGQKNMFNIGAGLRLSNSNLSGLQMESVGTNYTKIKAINVDGNLYNLNLLLSAEFSYKGKFCIGVNSDIFGILIGSITPDANAFGPKNTNDQGEKKFMALGGQLPGLNYNLLGNSSHGSTTSELYGGVHVNKKIWIKAGIAQVKNEMLLSQANDRFIKTNTVFILGARLRF